MIKIYSVAQADLNPRSFCLSFLNTETTGVYDHIQPGYQYLIRFTVTEENTEVNDSKNGLMDFLFTCCNGRNESAWLGVVAHTCNSRTWKAEAGES